jgi:serine/threonine-protein kinase RsbT
MDQIKIAIATLELAKNLVIHAMRRGKIIITHLNEPNPGILVVAQDKGTGLQNIENTPENSSTTKNEVGSGLDAVKRLMDQLTIENKQGEGTTIIAKKWTTPKK